MKQKHIDASREARLWIGQVIVPILAVTGILAYTPEVHNTVTNKVEDIKRSIRNKFKKG
jgi:hypothetical protein